MSTWFWVVIRLDRIEGAMSDRYNDAPTRAHDSLESARAEAKRLAGVNPGSKFGVGKVEEFWLLARPEAEQTTLDDPVPF